MGSLQEDGGREAPNVRISAVVGSAVNPQQLGPRDTVEAQNTNTKVKYKK